MSGDVGQKVAWVVLAEQFEVVEVVNEDGHSVVLDGVTEPFRHALVSIGLFGQIRGHGRIVAAEPTPRVARVLCLPLILVGETAHQFMPELAEDIGVIDVAEVSGPDGEVESLVNPPAESAAELSEVEFRHSIIPLVQYGFDAHRIQFVFQIA